MTQPEERNVERRLREVGAPPPPADLLDRLHEEIPERPRMVRFPRGAEAAGSSDRSSRRRRYLLAATIAIAAIGASLTLHLADLELSSPERRVVFESPAPYTRPDRARAVPGARPGDPASIVPERPAGEAESGSRDDGREVEDPRASSGRQEDVPSAAADAMTGDLLGQPAPAPSTEPRASAEQEEPMLRGLAETPVRPRPRLRDGGPPYRSEPRSREELQSLGYVARQGSSRLRSIEPGAAAPPSTGGTTEPNDQPYGDMFFESYGVNPFIDTEDDNLSTFGLDVDTGSYTVARSYVTRGHLPPPAAVRVEEFVNFFDYGDEPPEDGDFAIRLEGAPAPFAEGPRYQLLRIGIRARDVTAAERPPATLVFVVDVSGSMAREDRLGLVQQSLALLLDQLRPDDRVGLVVYGSYGQVLLEPTGDHQAIRAAIGRLAPGGSTNAEEGLVLAYGLAEQSFREEAINRVILCSDGVANVGRTGPGSILERIGAAAERGIELTTVGFGMGNYNDVLMEQLADRGDGSYAYVDSLPEARRIFVENLTGMLQTVAREAKVQVEFDRSSVERYRLLGYENRDIADERFRDDTVDAGEIGAGHSVTALYEIKLAEKARPRDRLATVRLRYHSVERGEVIETAEELRLRDLASSWESAPPSLELAAVVAELAEILRRSYWAKDGDLAALFAEAQRLSAAYAGDVEVAELVTLIGSAARLDEARRGD